MGVVSCDKKEKMVKEMKNELETTVLVILLLELRVLLGCDKKEKVVKEIKNELEMRSLNQITHFCKRGNKIEQKD